MVSLVPVGEAVAHPSRPPRSSQRWASMLSAPSLYTHPFRANRSQYVTEM